MTPEEKMFEAIRKKDDNYFKNIPENVSINAQDEWGDTLLHKLVKTDYVPYALPCILKRDPNPFIKNNDAMTPRMLALWRGNTSQAAFLAAYEASYTEKQHRFQVKCQADIFSELIGMIDVACASPLFVSTSKAKEIIAQMRRGANGRAD